MKWLQMFENMDTKGFLKIEAGSIQLHVFEKKSTPQTFL